MPAFTKGNIVVYRVGNGTAAASGTAVVVYLDEYTPTGQLVQSVAMPVAASGANRALTSSNNAATEGLLTLSADGRYLVLTGYDAAPGQTGVAATTSAAVNRVIGRVGADASIDTSTTVTAFSGVSIRSVASLDGGQFWVSGANTGIVYQTLGGSGAGTTILSSPTNNRALGIYDGQLYVGSGSSPFVGIDRVGTGTPTTAGQTATLLTGSSATNPYQFFFADLTADVAGVDTLYVADNTGTNGLEKFSLVGGAWVLNNKITTPTGMIGLTGSASGSTVSMFITTASGIYALTDTSGYNANDNGTATQIVTAGANTAFRGVAFAPSIASTGTIGFVTTAVSHVEGEGGATTAFTYTLVRSGSTAAAATIGYAVSAAAGTTTLDGNDFQGGVLPAGTVTFAAGQAQVDVTITVVNDTVFEGDESFTVTLSNPSTGYTLATATASGTIIDDDDPGAFSIAKTSDAIEGGNAVFTITRTGGSAGVVDVGYATVTGVGTASAADFVGGVLPGGTVRFAAGQTSATVTIATFDDTLVEGDEQFALRLTTASAGTVGTGTATATIVDNDVAGTVAIASGRAAEGAGGVPLVVTRTGDLSQAATFTWTVSIAAGNTADAADFGGRLPSGSITFAAGASQATILVPVTDDATIEADETFTVTLTDPAAAVATSLPWHKAGLTSWAVEPMLLANDSVAAGGDGRLASTLGIADANAVITTATATGTIVNDDFPALSVSDASVVEGNDGTVTLVFTITSNVPAGAGGIGFTIATADGTATAGSDYVARTATGTIAAGQTSTTFTVTVNGDTLPEGPETVLVNLSNVTGAVVADGQGVGTIINDDGAPSGPQLLYATQFDGFTAAGFAPGATGARLDSNVFRVLGMSDLAAPAYGFTSPAIGGAANDFGRGVIQGSADPTSGGVYSPSANPALVIQPTGSDFVEGNGAIEARIQNTSGFTATSFDVSFDWAYRNSGGRASTLQLSYSSDGVTFTPVPSTAFTTPGTADTTVAATFSNTTAMVSIADLVVADGGYLYLRWNHTGSSGSGNRDEIGIDNVAVRATVTDASTLTFADVTVAEGNSGETIATLTLTRTGVAGAASVQFATTDGVALAGSDYRAQSGTVSFAAGEATKTIQLVIFGDTRNEPSESFFVNFTNPQGFLLPDAQARVTIANDDTGPVAIYDIQGLGHRSSYEGLTVATSGVVTAVRTTGSDRGFYLQDAAGDGDSRTSDAIFVSTGAVSPTVAVGNAITLSGTVTEYTANAVNLTVTRLTGATGITVTNAAAALPNAVLISTEAGGYAPPTEVIDDDRLQSYDPATDGIDYYESLEGMLVTVRAPLVVSATDAIGQTYVVANQGIGATGINSRYGITISAGDNAPEKIKIYAPGGGAFDQGDVLGDVTGILTYFGSSSGTSASYEVDPSTALTVAVDRAAPTRETSLLRGDADHLTIASFNVENADPGDGAAKFRLIATEVVSALNSPDIIGLQEVQDADGAGTGTDTSGLATAQAMIDAIVAAGGPTYRYVEIAPAYGTTGGEPGGNIRNGYLYNPSRVSLVEGSVRLIEDQAFTGSRRPLVASFTFNGEAVTVVNAHSTSRGGSDTLFGAIQPPAQAGDGSRTAQATAIKAYLDSVQAANPAAKLVTVGDFNGYYYETALSRLTADGKFANLYTLLPVEERYSYLFEGYLQAFDNIVVSNNLTAGASFDVVHYNAEQPESVRITDHDQPIARLYIPAPNTAPTDLALDTATVAENAPAGTAVGTVTATDREGGTFRFALVSGDGFAIDEATGRLTTTRAFDFETTPSATVTVRVTDAGGLSFEKQLTVTITDVNETPSTPTLSPLTVAENAGVGTLVGTVASTDPERGTLTYSLVSGEGFAVDAATGRLTTTRVFDFETTPNATVVVRATDAGGLSTDARFTITVTDVNEAPSTPTLSPLTVAENAATGTLVGTVASTDPERGTLRYSLVSGEGFAVDAATGRLTTTRAFDFETMPSVAVVVRATDAGGLSTDARFTVSVTNVNEAPARVTLSNASVAENSVGGTVIGTLSGNDPDAGDAVTFRLNGTDTRFRIEGNQLLVASGAAIDYEAERSIALSVTATDRAGLSVTTPLTIAVTDVAETFAGTSGNDTLVGDAGDNTLSGLAGDDTLLGNAGNDTLDGGDGADVLNGGAGTDRLTLGNGADTVRGLLSDLLGDTITDFGAEDRIVIQRSDIARGDIRVTGSGASTALVFSAGQVALSAGLSGGDIMVAHQGTDSVVSFHTYLAALSEGAAVAGSAINGVTNQRYLAGDTASSFTVNVEALSGAKYANALGVYEIDRATGAIVDVRIIAGNVKTAGAITVTGVEAGHDLGFFLVQDGARTLSDAALTGGNLSLIRQGSALVLAQNGTALSGVTTFVSHDAASNVDGQAHVLSGVAGDGSGAIRLGFEDLLRSGRGSDDDFQDVVLTVTAVRETHATSAAFETHAAAAVDHGSLLMVEPLPHGGIDGVIG